MELISEGKKNKSVFLLIFLSLENIGCWHPLCSQYQKTFRIKVLTDKQSLELDKELSCHSLRLQYPIFLGNRTTPSLPG